MFFNRIVSSFPLFSIVVQIIFIKIQINGNHKTWIIMVCVQLFSCTSAVQILNNKNQSSSAYATLQNIRKSDLNEILIEIRALRTHLIFQFVFVVQSFSIFSSIKNNNIFGGFTVFSWIFKILGKSKYFWENFL